MLFAVDPVDPTWGPWEVAFLLGRIAVLAGLLWWLLAKIVREGNQQRRERGRVGSNVNELIHSINGRDYAHAVDQPVTGNRTYGYVANDSYGQSADPTSLSPLPEEPSRGGTEPVIQSMPSASEPRRRISRRR